MRIDIITLFPEMFQGPFDYSIIKRAREKGIVSLNLFNLRDFSQNKHRQVDDYPYGGGQGMVIQAGPVFRAVESLRQDPPGSRVALMCPGGATFDQDKARELAGLKQLVIVCGHYEGVDERVKESLVDEEISIGDYVLTGGEIPAMAVVDSVVRLLPGVLADPESVQEESFYRGLLEYPQYTRPEEYRGLKVPGVLLSGNHGKIRQWRRYQSLKRTLERRPGLLEQAPLSQADREMLQEMFLGGEPDPRWDIV